MRNEACIGDASHSKVTYGDGGFLLLPFAVGEKQKSHDTGQRSRTMWLSKYWSQYSFWREGRSLSPCVMEVSQSQPRGMPALLVKVYPGVSSQQEPQLWGQASRTSWFWHSDCRSSSFKKRIILHDLFLPMKKWWKSVSFSHDDNGTGVCSFIFFPKVEDETVLSTAEAPWATIKITVRNTESCMIWIGY